MNSLSVTTDITANIKTAIIDENSIPISRSEIYFEPPITNKTMPPEISAAVSTKIGAASIILVMSE